MPVIRYVIELDISDEEFDKINALETDDDFEEITTDKLMNHADLCANITLIEIGEEISHPAVIESDPG